ncbi:MAG: phytanoyl-CoA dioxygenase family protein [Fimbriimonas sp.]
MVQPEVLAEYQAKGFAIASGLFSAEECDHYREYFTAMVERGGDGWAEGTVDPNHSDPLKRYPRLLQPHRGDDVAFGYMVDPRIDEHLTAFMGQSPFAVQTMVYFKPPGARGQNLHQDNTYLQVQPGTCIAAWMALEDIDEENGCMVLVPESQELPIICQKETPGLSEICWGDWETPIPAGLTPEQAIMKKGDVLFFNGSVIHGSYMNRSDRFRRTLIGHYIAAETEQVAKYYFPVFRMDGSRLDDEALRVAPEGAPCGTYVERENEWAIEFDGGATVAATGAH